MLDVLSGVSNDCLQLYRAGRCWPTCNHTVSLRSSRASGCIYVSVEPDLDADVGPHGGAASYGPAWIVSCVERLFDFDFFFFFKFGEIQ